MRRRLGDRGRRDRASAEPQTPTPVRRSRTAMRPRAATGPSAAEDLKRSAHEASRALPSAAAAVDATQAATRGWFLCSFSNQVHPRHTATPNLFTPKAEQLWIHRAIDAQTAGAQPVTSDIVDCAS